MSHHKSLGSSLHLSLSSSLNLLILGLGCLNLTSFHPKLKTLYTFGLVWLIVSIVDPHALSCNNLVPIIERVSHIVLYDCIGQKMRCIILYNTILYYRQHVIRPNLRFTICQHTYNTKICCLLV